MTLTSLISAILAKFPDARLSEIATALCISEKNVSEAIRHGGGLIAMPKRQRDGKVAQRIEEFANEFAGGRLEIISIPNERLAICINRRLVA